MAPKKKSGDKKLGDTKSVPEGFTPERFEKELKDLAAKAKKNTWGKRAVEQVSLLAKSAAILILLGIYSTASQLNLSPVYGSIPSAAYHSKLLMGGCFIGWAGNIFLWRTLPFKPEKLLPLIAVYAPTIQFFLFTLSAQLTAEWGPLVTEALTLFPLSIISAACVATYLDDVDLSVLPKSVADATPGIGSWALFKFIENLSGSYIPVFAAKTFFLTRVGLEMALAGIYTIFAPSKLLALAIPALVHTAVFNTHVMLPSATLALEKSLAADNYTLLERQESLTGYISVLENSDQGFRVMRCDHSLLGGNWVRYKTPTGIAEPIYAVFVMLEAIRFVVVPDPVPDNEASALVIGLGIGTTPTALMAHGIDTTIVEIDPVVYDFAVKYFNLTKDHTAVIDDAVSYTATLASTTDKKFDYIVHDVFTGGAEPVELFTLEFLQTLSNLLKPNGVVAINYAGDFLHPPPKIVVQTIREVFPSCRIFREGPRNATAIEEEQRDFTNMVIFCTKLSDGIKLRLPRQADLLGSISRQNYMYPVHEVLDSDFLSEGYEGVLLRQNSTSELEKWHKKSALGHWRVMRTVMPASAWEKW